MTDGAVLAASQGRDDNAPENGGWDSEELLQRVHSWPTGTENALLFDNREPWVVSYRVLGELPLVVAFGLPHAVVFAAWENSVWQDVLMLLVAIATCGFIVLLLNRRERLRREAETLIEKNEQHRFSGNNE